MLRPVSFREGYISVDGFFWMVSLVDCCVVCFWSFCLCVGGGDATNSKKNI